MPLQFDPSAYGQAFQQGEENRLENEQMPLQALSVLGQGIQSYADNKNAKSNREQQKKLYELQLEEAMRKNREADLENTPIGQLLSSNSLSGEVSPTSLLEQMVPPTPMGGLPMNQQSGAGLVERFRMFQQGKLRAPEMKPDNTADAMTSFGLPTEAAGMTPRQLKLVGESRKLFSETKKDQPGSIDAILADRVNKGQLTLEQAMEMKKKMSPDGSFMMGGINSEGNPVFYNSKDPTKVKTGEVPGGGTLYPKTPSEGQMNASLFGRRALEANQQIEDLLSKGVDPSSYETGLQSYLPNFLQSGGVQQVEQAKRNFINAVLRKESGATITPAEMENANKQYFPQVGDSPEVIEQKRINRTTAIQGLSKMAGPLADNSALPTSTQSGWDSAKEARYQELLKKRGGR